MIIKRLAPLQYVQRLGNMEILFDQLAYFDIFVSFDLFLFLKYLTQLLAATFEDLFRNGGDKIKKPFLSHLLRIFFKFMT